MLQCPFYYSSGSQSMVPRSGALASFVSGPVVRNLPDDYESFKKKIIYYTHVTTANVQEGRKITHLLLCLKNLE